MRSESLLGWVGYSAEATRRLAADLEGESDGVVYEMGVLAIHSGYADLFFPDGMFPIPLFAALYPVTLGDP